MLTENCFSLILGIFSFKTGNCVQLLLLCLMGNLSQGIGLQVWLSLTRFTLNYCPSHQVKITLLASQTLNLFC